MISFFLLATTYLYTETVNNSTEDFSWVKTETDKGIELISKVGDRITTIRATKELSILEMSIASPRSSLDMKQEQGYVNATRQGEERPKTVSHPLHGKPWIQQMWFGLEPFAKSNDKKMYFYTLDPRTLDVHKLIVTRGRYETIKINDIDYKAEKMEITLPGLKSAFWKAYIWFEEGTHRFLKYKGNKGPGTSTSIIYSMGVKE